jgi:hypothetical protein
MKVKELREALAKLDQEKEIEIVCAQCAASFDREVYITEDDEKYNLYN